MATIRAVRKEKKKPDLEFGEKNCKNNHQFSLIPTTFAYDLGYYFYNKILIEGMGCTKEGRACINRGKFVGKVGKIILVIYSCSYLQGFPVY
ncbi:hypothetical protein [Bacillus sp. B-jedd]|uniref:hypothetical protein n=1 Tax=Bacillus sp. B-jedd TaxID=1476857 RepID=UPI0011DC857A|nr:hypothetical protein [Bacillus sp. B-jedd]